MAEKFENEPTVMKSLTILLPSWAVPSVGASALTAVPNALATDIRCSLAAPCLCGAVGRLPERGAVAIRGAETQPEVMVRHFVNGQRVLAGQPPICVPLIWPIGQGAVRGECQHQARNRRGCAMPAR